MLVQYFECNDTEGYNTFLPNLREVSLYLCSPPSLNMRHHKIKHKGMVPFFNTRFRIQHTPLLSDNSAIKSKFYITAQI